MVIGKNASCVIVECRGIHHKEIVVHGMGGNMGFDIQPRNINLGTEI
jgi:hypothetical protein